MTFPRERYMAMRLAAVLAGTVILVSAYGRAQQVIPPGGYRDEDGSAEGLERIKDDIRIRIARVRYGGGGDWYADPSSLPNLLREFGARTGIPTARDEMVVDLGDPELSSYPFLYMTGHGNVRCTGKELDTLRRYLLEGGFLYADDNYGMDASFRVMVRELFPERELVVLPLDHEIYRCFYELEGPPKIHEHDGKPPEGLGIFDGERLVLFYTHESDIGDGLEDPDVHGDPPAKREQALRMAVNVLFYALTR